MKLILLIATGLDFGGVEHGGCSETLAAPANATRNKRSWFARRWRRGRKPKVGDASHFDMLKGDSQFKRFIGGEHPRRKHKQKRTASAGEQPCVKKTRSCPLDDDRGALLHSEPYQSYLAASFPTNNLYRVGSDPALQARWRNGRLYHPRPHAPVPPKLACAGCGGWLYDDTVAAVAVEGRVAPLCKSCAGTHP